jgi:hypothetical protein
MKGLFRTIQHWSDAHSIDCRRTSLRSFGFSGGPVDPEARSRREPVPGREWELAL